MRRIRQEVECTAILECPNECVAVELDGTEFTDGVSVFERFLDICTHCPKCGSTLDSISQKEKVGRLE